MKTFLQQDSVKLNDTFKKKIETVEIVQGSGFVRVGDEFNNYSQFHTAYGEMAGLILRQRKDIEKYLARIGLYFVEQGDTKIITKVGDEVGNMLYDFYLANDEPVISHFTATWRDENREKINQFLRDKPWEKNEGRLRFRDYGFSQGVASPLFIAMPQTRLFEIEEADFEIKLPEGCLWTIDRAYKVVGMTNPKRTDITCVCGKQMKMYRVSGLENGCLSCQSCARRTTDFDVFYKSIADEGYTVIKDFEDDRPTKMSRIILQCPDETHQPYSTYRDNWGSGRRCPACSAFRVGEKKAREFLQSRDVPFKEQIKFDGLIGLGGGQLSYDFMFELNGEAILLEIDGSGHFSPTTFGGRDIDVSEQAYQQQVEHDRRKTDFAVQNGFRLVRIQNVNKDYDFILNSLEAILSGSTNNHFGSLYK